VQDVNVEINISHAYTWDLRVWLMSPAETLVELISPKSRSGENFTATVLDDEATSSIDSCSSNPCTGIWRPEQPLSAFDGESPNGTWTLIVEDLREVKLGTLDSWSLTIIH
jgi:subtilisin-like proprotein convertase family protein